MLSEFKKSIESILYQRVTSPLYGTMVVTWLLWNWKIWYITFFVDSDKLAPLNKLDYLVSKCDDIHRLITFPLISTAIILTLIPFVVNGAYWLDMKFKTWRVGQKSIIEGKQLLSLEKSIQLRKEISDQEERFDKLLGKKDEEIAILKEQLNEINNLQKANENKEVVNKRETVYQFDSDDYSLLSRNPDVYKNFGEIIKSIEKSSHLPENTPEKMADFLVINGIIDPSGASQGKRIYYVTKKGKELYKVYLNLNYNK